MKVNTDKTEFCLYTRNLDHKTPTIRMKDKVLKSVEKVKVLGVILDKKLTFQPHIDMVERKAAKALGQLMIVGKTEKISPTNMIKLYNIIEVPQMEYAAPVWQIASCRQLEKIQRKGLALCLACPNTASCEALEVQSGVLPLDLRREEISTRECVKVMAKPSTEMIKQSLTTCQSTLERDSRERIVTPFGKMLEQVHDMTSMTDIGMKMIEPEVSYLEYLQPSKRKPEYWSNLGSSKSRSKDQEAESRPIIEGMLNGIGSQTIVAFTDGSCRGNPGPCGAGSCIILPNGEKIELKQPVAKLASILLGELVAIKMTLDFIIEEQARRQIDTVLIFSDSQTSVGILHLGWENKTHKKKTTTDIQQVMKDLQQQGTEVKIQWSPGHANITGNEVADRLAKEAAKEAEDMTEDRNSVTTHGEVRQAAKEAVTMKWKRRQELSDKDRDLFQFKPTVKLKKTSFCALKNQRVMLQLQSGYSQLREYQHKLSLVQGSR